MNILTVKHQLRLVLVIGILLLNAACGIKLVYNNLDYLIPAYIDSLVDLGELEPIVDEEVISFLAWHQRDQLPKYTNWLQSLLNLIDEKQVKEIKPEKVFLELDKVSSFWIQTRSKLSVELAHLLPLLNPAQINELYLSLEENNTEFIQTNISLSADEKQDLYQQRLVDNFEEWLGYLTEAQELRLHQSVSQFKTLSKLRLSARLEWQRLTKQILYSDTKNKQQQLLALFKRLSQKHDQQYKSINNSNRLLLSKLISDIYATLEQQQKKHLTEEIVYYLSLIDEIKKQSWK